ncbi:uncharacterized protein LOC129944776, partial [Eupeodes corollae]|uniref:uncharacterized protein LOC129944776 n=1 Tax=Eupeodes corollae TaxID=290404 RepID=UPI00248F590E
MDANAMARVLSFLENAPVQILKEKLVQMNLSTHGTKTSLKARLNEAIDSLEPEQIENLFPVVDQESEASCDDAHEDEDGAVSQRLEKLRELVKKKEEIAALEKRLVELSTNSPIREFQHVSAHSSRDIEESLPLFSGDDNYSISKWIENVEDAMVTNHLSDSEAFIYFKRLLKGTAKLFLRSRTFRSWKDLRAALMSEFHYHTTATDVHNTLRNRKKRRDENYQQYVLSMQEIASSAEIDEQDVIAYIIKGIPDSIFNKQIMLTANTIADLKNILRKYEKMKSELQPTSSGYNRSVQPSRSVPGVDAKVRCFNCDEEGHISRNCPKACREKGSCFRCGQKGHIITNCPQKSSVLAVKRGKCTMKSPVSTLMTDFHGVLEYEIKSANREAESFGVWMNIMTVIDTGSPISFIQQRYVPPILMTSLEPSPCNFVGINSSQLVILEKPYKTNMKIVDLRLFYLLSIAVKLTSSFEVPEENNIVVDTLVFAVKHIKLQQSSTFHIGFSSKSNQSAYQQTSIINGFLLKSDRDHVVRLDDIGSSEYVPTERRKFTLLLIDSLESFQTLDMILKSRQYHTNGKHLVLLSETLPRNETEALIQSVFDKFFSMHLANVELIVQNITTGFTDFYTFYPVTSSYCFKIIPVLHNTFNGNATLHDLKLFPPKFNNFYGCPLVVTAFHFPPHVFLWHENGEVKVSGFDILVLSGVAEKLNFSIKPTDAEVRGILLANGSLTGALAVLKRAEANITLGGFGSTSKAMLQFSPSLPYYHSSMVFAIPPPREYSALEKLLLPFDIDIWLAIGLTFGVTLFASITLEMWSKRLRDLFFGDTVKDPVFEMIIVYLGGAVVRFPKGALARNVILQWLIASTILSSCYKAILFGMLKTGFLKKFPMTIEGMLDLGFVADVPFPLMPNVKEGLLGGRKQFFLQEYSLHTHYDMLQLPNSNRLVIDTRIQLEYYNTLNYKKSGILGFLPQRLFLFPMYFYYRKDSYLVEPFNKVLTTYKENGFMTHWILSILNVTHMKSAQISSETKPLYLKDFTSCLAICNILLGCSIVVFIFEIWSTKNKSIKKFFFRSHSVEKKKKKIVKNQ